MERHSESTIQADDDDSKSRGGRDREERRHPGNV